MNRCERRSADDAGDSAEQGAAVVLDRFSAVRNHVVASKGATILMDAISTPICSLSTVGNDALTPESSA